MLRQEKNKSAQVLLETAIVLVSLALLTIGSMRLFSNLNLNLIDRMEKFRISRKEAVNKLVFMEDPLEYLDFSPNTDSNTNDSNPWEGDDYGDTRIRDAYDLLQEAEEIRDVTLPNKATQISNLLSGDTRDIPKDKVEQARDLCIEMHSDAGDAYQKHIDAKDKLQQVIEDIDKGIAYQLYRHFAGLTEEAMQSAIERVRYRLSELKERIENLVDLEVIEDNADGSLWHHKGVVADLFLHQLRPRLWEMKDWLDTALGYYDNCNSIYCVRVYFINVAKGILQDILDYLGVSTAEGILPTLSADSVNVLIRDTRELLSGEVSNNELSQAINNCDTIANSLEQGSNAYNLVMSAKQDLQHAYTYTDDRQDYIDSARDKLGRIDISEGE